MKACLPPCAHWMTTSKIQVWVYPASCSITAGIGSSSSATIMRTWVDHAWMLKTKFWLLQIVCIKAFNFGLVHIRTVAPWVRILCVAFYKDIHLNIIDSYILLGEMILIFWSVRIQILTWKSTYKMQLIRPLCGFTQNALKGDLRGGLFFLLSFESGGVPSL